MYLRLFLLVGVARAAFISSSNFNECYNSNGVESCEPALSVLLSMGNNYEVPVEKMSFGFPNVTTPEGNTISPVGSINITITKTPTIIDYNLKSGKSYLRSIRELVLEYPGGDCEDDSLFGQSQDASCYDAVKKGYVTINQGGYCCACGKVKAMFYETHGVREYCGFTDYRESAHCFIQSKDTFDTFTVHGYTMATSYNVSVVGTNAKMEPVNYTATLRYGETTYSDENVSIDVIGNTQTSTSIPLLENGKLVVNSIKVNSSVADDELQGNATDEWMFLDPSCFGDENTCNKIGVTYLKGIWNQVNRCYQPVGSCTNGQIQDYILEDIAAVALGNPPKNKISRFGKFLGITAKKGDLRLRRLLTDPINSLVTVKVKASSFSFITNVGPGKIESILATDFRAFDQVGNVTVVAENTGSIAAGYILFVECQNARPKPAEKQIVLTRGEKAMHSFEIHALNTEGLNANCTVELKDGRNAVIDKKTIDFKIGKMEGDKTDPGTSNEYTPDTISAYNHMHFCLYTAPEVPSFVGTLFLGCVKYQKTPFIFFMISIGLVAIVAIAVFCFSSYLTSSLCFFPNLFRTSAPPAPSAPSPPPPQPQPQVQGAPPTIESNPPKRPDVPYTNTQSEILLSGPPIKQILKHFRVDNEVAIATFGAPIGEGQIFEASYDYTNDKYTASQPLAALIVNTFGNESPTFDLVIKQLIRKGIFVSNH